MTPTVTIAKYLHLLMPLLCSDESVTRKEVELDELLDWENFEDFNLVSDDFFTVFCVAVRLHSVKRNSTEKNREIGCDDIQCNHPELCV